MPGRELCFARHDERLVGAIIKARRSFEMTDSGREEMTVEIQGVLLWKVCSKLCRSEPARTCGRLSKDTSSECVLYVSVVPE